MIFLIEQRVHKMQHRSLRHTVAYVKFPFLSHMNSTGCPSGIMYNWNLPDKTILYRFSSFFKLYSQKKRCLKKQDSLHRITTVRRKYNSLLSLNQGTKRSNYLSLMNGIWNTTSTIAMTKPWSGPATIRGIWGTTWSISLLPRLKRKRRYVPINLEPWGSWV
jgi:hypothetical protein